MKRLLMMLTAMLAMACGNAYGQEYLTDADVAYSDAAPRCVLDVYHPADTTGRCPVVVWFHGGSLTSGGKFIPDELKESGYVVVAPNYRLMPDADVDDCIDDAAAAVAWTFANIGRYGGDPAHIFVSGHSAGGYLTSMVGLDKSRLARHGIDADSIAGLIPLSGQAVTHFSWRRKQGIPDLQPTIDRTAPLYHVRPDAPPYVIICGDRELELFGRYEENAYLWRMLRLTGHPDATIYELDGYNHGDMAHPAFHILKATVARLLPH